MAALLSLCATIVSCSNHDFYDAEAAAKLAQQQKEANYKNSFVEHFGEVPANQCWDFTMSSAPVAKTRANGYATPDWYQTHMGQIKNYPWIKGDYEQVKLLAETEQVVDWPFEYAQINLYPFYAHGNNEMYDYFFVGIDYKDAKKEKGKWVEVDKTQSFSVNAKYGFWYSMKKQASGTNDLNFNTYRHINTTNMEGVDGFRWWVGYSNKVNAANAQKVELTKCKCFVVNGRTYVAFNCDNDENGDYTDLICWVEDLTPSKRYMVEDLGGDSDFDFNDIVFDVRKKDNSNNKYECLVRALGGTLDLTITVGETTWTKSKDFDPSKMQNTIGPDYGMVLARFDVSGWIPEQNNVSVTVEGSEGAFVLPFPENGSVPFMVAVNVGKEWSEEWVSVEEIGWFSRPNPEIEDGE